MVTIEGSNVILPSGRHVSFEHKVAQLLEVEDFIVVRFEVPPGKIFNENVLCLDRQGGTVWKVPPRRHVYEDSPYTFIRLENDVVILGNWDGLVLEIEPRSGLVLNERHSK